MTTEQEGFRFNATTSTVKFCRIYIVYFGLIITTYNRSGKSLYIDLTMGKNICVISIFFTFIIRDLLHKQQVYQYVILYKYIQMSSYTFPLLQTRDGHTLFEQTFIKILFELISILQFHLIFRQFLKLKLLVTSFLKTLHLKC